MKISRAPGKDFFIVLSQGSADGEGLVPLLQSCGKESLFCKLLLRVIVVLLPGQIS